MSIVDSNNNIIHEEIGLLDKGFNFLNYNLKKGEEFLGTDTYKVSIIKDKDNLQKEFRIQ